MKTFPFQILEKRKKRWDARNANSEQSRNEAKNAQTVVERERASGL